MIAAKSTQQPILFKASIYHGVNNRSYHDFFWSI